MSEHWARADARRIGRRIRHAAKQRHTMTDAELSYLRRSAMALILDTDTELPDGWRDSLRELLAVLEAIATEREAAA